jgi:hypothetical protein
VKPTPDRTEPVFLLHRQKVNVSESAARWLWGIDRIDATSKEAEGFMRRPRSNVFVRYCGQDPLSPKENLAAFCFFVRLSELERLARPGDFPKWSFRD